MKDIKLANLPGMGEVLAVAQVENVPHAKVAVIDGKRTTASCGLATAATSTAAPATGGTPVG